jgi:hypothetical protein
MLVSPPPDHPAPSFRPSSHPSRWTASSCRTSTLPAWGPSMGCVCPTAHRSKTGDSRFRLSHSPQPWYTGYTNTTLGFHACHQTHHATDNFSHNPPCSAAPPLPDSRSPVASPPQHSCRSRIDMLATEGVRGCCTSLGAPPACNLPLPPAAASTVTHASLTRIRARRARSIRSWPRQEQNTGRQNSREAALQWQPVVLLRHSSTPLQFR